MYMYVCALGLTSLLLPARMATSSFGRSRRTGSSLSNTLEHILVNMSMYNVMYVHFIMSHHILRLASGPYLYFDQNIFRGFPLYADLQECLSVQLLMINYSLPPFPIRKDCVYVSEC